MQVSVDYEWFVNFSHSLTKNLKTVESSGFARNDSWVGAYRALGAVLYIVDRKLDLSLLSDQRVLKERYTAQEDRVTGALKTETEGEVKLF